MVRRFSNVQGLLRMARRLVRQKQALGSAPEGEGRVRGRWRGEGQVPSPGVHLRESPLSAWSLTGGARCGEQDDGAFWMAYGDFQQHFKQVRKQCRPARWCSAVNGVRCRSTCATARAALKTYGAALLRAALITVTTINRARSQKSSTADSTLGQIPRVPLLSQ